jgi:hypothetical protein
MVLICEPPAMGFDNADQLTAKSRTTADGLYGKIVFARGTWKESRVIPEFCGNGDRRRGRTGSSDRAMMMGEKKKIEKKIAQGFPRRARSSGPPPGGIIGEK